MKPHTVALAATLALVAAAAGADVTGAITRDNMDEHYQGLFTNSADICLNLELDGDERAPKCEAALLELENVRKAHPNPTMQEKADYDNYESLLQIALGNAYSKIDKGFSQRVCVAAERSWSLQYSLMSIPKDKVSASSYDSYHDVAKSVGRVLSNCRDQFGKPADAAPLP